MKYETLFSNDGGGFDGKGSYRYTLWRDLRDFATRWPDQYLMIIGLNPSTATGTEDDPTIKACKRHARRLGFGRLLMTNLFALRETQPAIMKRHHEPIGSENDDILLRHSTGAGMLLCAWGKDGTHKDRAPFVTRLLGRGQPLYCLRKNNDGSPEHPLYVPAVDPILWP